MTDREFFDLGPDADAKDLKRAYNRKLREHPPEKDPVGFMRLRAAYERLQEELEHGAAREEEELDFLDEDGAKAPRSTEGTREPELSIPEGPRFRWDRSIFGKTGWGRDPVSDADASPTENVLGKWLFLERPEAYGDQEERVSRVFPVLRKFGADSPREIAFPDDDEVHPIWMAFCDLWTQHRGEPGLPAWKDLFDLLDLDHKFRTLFARRLCAFWRIRFLTSAWLDVSVILLWKLAVAVRWDRDPSDLEEVVGRPVGEILSSWRINAVVHTLSENLQTLIAEVGWDWSRRWMDFFEMVHLDEDIARVFFPIARGRIERHATFVTSGEDPGWILEGIRPRERVQAPVDLGPEPVLRVDVLQEKDRSMVWGIALIGIAVGALLVYQVVLRLMER